MGEIFEKKTDSEGKVTVKITSTEEKNKSKEEILQEIAELQTTLAIHTKKVTDISLEILKLENYIK